jgi:hypothetical protein
MLSATIFFWWATSVQKHRDGAEGPSLPVQRGGPWVHTGRIDCAEARVSGIDL